MSLEDSIKKFALHNAIQFEGKASSGAVIGKILAQYPDAKKDMATISKQIAQIISEVNSLSKEEQTSQLEQLAPELLEKKKKEKREFSLPELKNTENLVMRFAPNPNGPLSFGHTRQVLLNWWFTQKYEGKFILRFDDTDPRTKIPLKSAYTSIQEDCKWLGVNVDKVYIQSERFDIYYKYAEKLILQGKAYVDLLPAEEKRELLQKGLPCENRDLPAQTQLERWMQMLSNDGYKEGEAILRMKTNLAAKNPAVRDWPAFRIITSGSHPLKQAKVWPLLNFSSAIDDFEMNITHIVRGVDLAISDERQKFIYECFGWTYPQTMYTGKLLISGVKSTSESKKLIDLGKLSGWDDIRLGTVQALRKRGYVKEAFHSFVKSVGTNKNNVEVSLQSLAAFNKEILEASSNRYFFIANPIVINVENAPPQTVELDLHPSLRKGGRVLQTNNEFYLDKSDLKDIKEGELLRLMDCMNIKKTATGWEYAGDDYQEYKAKGKRIIHWVPKELAIPLKVRMPTNEVIEGFAEPTIKNIQSEEVVQFERFGFCKNNLEEFWYTHE